MNINIVGHHISMGEALKTHAQSKLESVVKKYFKRAVDGKIIFDKRRHSFNTEILVHEASREYAFADAEANDAYASFDGALHKIEVQLSKQKDKVKNHNNSKHNNENF